MADNLDQLKKDVFFSLLGMAGRVFVAVAYGDDVIIGKRGFLPQEKEKGIILVFNSNMSFSWDEDAVTATLVFGSTPEKCHIPVERITTIFSPELHAQFTTFPREGSARDGTKQEIGDAHQNTGKVVKVDFKKSRPR